MNPNDDEDHGTPHNDGGHGVNIRTLRQARGMTLAELALRAGTDAGNLSRLERGLQGYDSGTLEAIACALGVPIVMLFSDDGALTLPLRPDLGAEYALVPTFANGTVGS